MYSFLALKVFVAVVEARGIKGAADRLGRTVSTISTTLKQLEEAVGAPLFEGDRKNRLTPLGRLVHEEARDLLEHYERSCAAIRAYSANEVGHVHVACVPSVAVALLPEVIRHLRRAPRPIEIEVRDMDSVSVTEAVVAGVVDVGVANGASQMAGGQFTPLFSDPLDLVCRAEDPLAALDRPISWDDLAGRVFLAHRGYGAIRDKRFRAIAGQAQVTVRNVLSLLALVKADVGVTLLPRLCGQPNDQALRFLPVNDLQARRVVGLVERGARMPSPAATLFAHALRSVSS
ncbi:LysR family transcriptional regulator [Ancylobacter amanitiformis]|uniref:DNA-binding transcriptional LysR family regulator n=1 Tax=Ancylobacter amanitiformis TaxID=217069 RepID=A0ABU0LVD9_9HYPH|nr:LysR family transcriptional regulator [Ancylobacter amanitiformis]MDQ0512634.1 DNA-binding transcriptional LysR family regulator [Ancylobacter amanitiformis]